MAFEPQNTGLVSHELRAGLSWRLFLFLLILFSTLFLAYLGLQFGYKTFLNNSIANYDRQIAESSTQVGEVEQNNLIGFYSQIVNLKRLLGQHVFASNLFDFLEANTHSRVAFSTVSLNTQTSELSLDGVADSYSNLVSQISHFENQPGVRRVTLGQNAADRSVVRFSIKINLDPNFFNLNNRNQQ